MVTDLSNDAFTNITNAPVDVIYTVVPVTASGCIGEAFTITATINPEPVVVNQTVTTCSDIAINLVLGDDADGPTAATYNITTINSSGLFASAGLPVLGTGFSANELINDAWTNKTTTPVNVIYTVEPVSSLGCKGNPFTVTLTVKPEPVVANQTLTVCSDRAANLALGSDVDGPSVASYSILNINNGGLVSSAGTPVIGSGLTANELLDDAWTNNTSASVNVVYTVVPLGSNGCDGDSFTVTVTVSPEPAVANQISTSCSESQIGIMLGNDIDGPTVTLYNIVTIDTNGLVPYGGSPSIGVGLLSNAIYDDAWTNTTNTPKEVVYTVVPLSGLGCEGDSFIVTVTISPKPTIPNQSDIICSGDMFMIAPVNNQIIGVIVPLGTTYTWTVVDNPNVLGETDQLNPQANISQALTNFTSIVQIINYTVTPISGTCQGTPFTLAVSVNPRPFIPNAPQLTDTRCSGEAFNIIPQNGIPDIFTIVPIGTTYIWTVPVNNLGATSSILPGLTSISQVLINPTNTIQSVTYSVTPSSGTCIGIPFNVKIWIEPKPFIPTVLETICNQSAFVLAPINAQLPTPTTIIPNITKYTWGAPTVTGGVTGWATGTDTLFFNSGILDNPTPFIQTVTFHVTPSYYVISNPNVIQCAGDSFDIIVTVNPKVTPQEVITNVLCYNSVPLCAASITLNPIGGIPFSYAWTSLSIPLNPLINPIDRDQFNLCPGDYKLEITDTFNCKYSFIYVVAPPTPIIESLVIHQDISCNNTSIPPCDGYVELAISGGTPLSTPTVYGYNYIFEWYKESTTIPGLFDYLVSTGMPILQNACEGNYRLKTVDANGCILWSQIQTILKLFVPISVVETVSNYNGWSVKCNGDSNGFIHDLISGGSGLYTYTLTNDIAPLVIISSGSISAGGVIPPLNTALNIDNIPAGNYTLTIHDSACPYDIVLQYQLTEPTLLQSSINIINPILCNGGKATYEAAPSGGTFPYSYVWFPSGETTSVATNLPLGPYSCLITDDNGCTITKSGAISEPTALQAVASVSSPILCYGGTASITVTAIGGTGPYTGTGVFTGVSAGISPTYVVTDFNGCQATVSILVPTPSLLEAQAVITNPILCHGGNATITITASGGTPNYLQTGIFSVPAGNHTFVVFDSNGCPASISITVMEPTLLTAYATVTTPILCNGGSGVVTVSGLGGTPTYSGVGTFNAVAGVNTYVINDANGCSIPVTITVNEPTLLVANAVVLNPIKCHGGMATISVTGSGGVSPYVGTGTFQALAGIHTYSIRDANNCIQTFTITITEPTLLVATASITSPILCYGGTAVVSVSAIGGVSPYTVVGNYTVIAGVYSYTVVDANNCSTTATINVTQPGLLAFTIKSVSNPNCFPNRLYDNGTICIKITGGTAPIPVGAGWIQSTTIPGEWCLSGLSAATYTISVTDVNNCPSITRTVSLTRPTPLTAFTTDNVNVNCPTKNVSQTNYVFASGGVPGYVYNWSGGDACPGPINPQCMTTDINGNYFVDVNDQEGLALGCIAVQVPIIVNLPVIGDPLMSISSNASTVCGVYSINDPITFTNISTGNFTSVEWFIDGLSLAGSNLISHNFTTLGDHTITLVVNYTIGGVTCTYSITETIAVTRGYDMVVPNGFTPGNNDGINDNIKPEFNCMGVVEMRVYDTWGSLLYVESGTTLIGWDGKINGHESENGNYIIVVKATTLFGAVINFNGPFTLIK
ncbi:CHU_C Type IX secretion signal domain containing protein [Flavobacteriaceae bacterium]